ncbi:MAG: CYTH domain-containing protein [Shewanella sp.]|nr:CYTH domain-containing protein [Shewanella sp.]MCF1429532.1 CYTH domain-containing protein [Shewanella sp.]MCF1437607.1 CYTH domain-containing protein [Shewanella sp.]MCF1457716.1 CYTH domain-containing protein [Shewanella sp.]
MAAEIELKLFFNPAARQLLTEKLNSLEHAKALPTKQLTNRYFDTQDLQLRRWGMGLRVREEGERREQTIKTAGQVVGGIHSRSEYNIDIQAGSPALKLFPADIWPVGADLDALQQQLVCFFDTDFSRQLWHVYVGNSMVEIALDIGWICAGEHHQAICELEFELLAGDVAALLKLAQTVAHWLPVRLGKASKAQRGYQLASGARPLPLDAISYVALDSSHDVRSGLQTLLETCIERWQLLEQAITQSADVPLQCAGYWQRLRSIIRLLKMTLHHFELWNEAYNSGFLTIESGMRFLDDALSLAVIIEDQLLARHEQAEVFESKASQRLAKCDLGGHLLKLQQQPQYGQLQLAVVRLLLDLSNGLITLPKQHLKQMADRMQELSWQRILELMPPDNSLSENDFLSAAQTLDEAILVGFAYGELYPVASRDSFRAPWRDLYHGIRALAGYSVLDEMSQETDAELHDWLSNKRQSLILALDFSRKSAQAMTPYWRR